MLGHRSEPGMPPTDRLREAQDALTASVAALTSSDEWRTALDFVARFHDYSFGNALLIRLQRPDATRVAGYQRWRELGRNVRRGEHGICILAPVTYRKKVDADDETDPVEIRAVRGFRSAFVFDVAQTDGEELPRTVFADRLTGGGDLERASFDALASSLRATGWTVNHVAQHSLAALGASTANGCTVYDKRAVLIRDDLDIAQQFKTLAHEHAHVTLHGELGSRQDRALMECEAESASYIALRVLGIEAVTYSAGYLAAWSSSDPRTLQKAGTNALRAARATLEALGIRDTR
jgi:antirestriction protein ArdC